MPSTCKEAALEDTLNNILCDGVVGHPKRYAPPIKHGSPPSTTALSRPLTVMGINRTPVVIEDPVRFRKDIQTMVMAQMMSGLPDEDQIEKIDKTGSMIEIATVKQLVKAACGDLDAFKYMMDRIMGKPVNQTNTVSMAVSYEQMLDSLDPDEVIEPKHVFCEEV